MARSETLAVHPSGATGRLSSFIVPQQERGLRIDSRRKMDQLAGQRQKTWELEAETESPRRPPPILKRV